MKRRSFLKGLLALPSGLVLGIKLPPRFNWKTASTILVSRSLTGVPRPMTATDILRKHEEMRAGIKKAFAKTYFAPNPMFESLRKKS